MCFSTSLMIPELERIRGHKRFILEELISWIYLYLTTPYISGVNHLIWIKNKFCLKQSRVKKERAWEDLGESLIGIQNSIEKPKITFSLSLFGKNLETHV
ncbi:hypothetical protein ACJX0J_015542 [Zea mays]